MLLGLFPNYIEGNIVELMFLMYFIKYIGVIVHKD